MIAFGMPVLPQADESLEVIVVTGRLPGPPLWRVFSGDHVMYIFPMLSLVPEDMDWDSGRVEYLLSESDEVLLMPSIDTDFSPLVLMNPVNLIRGPRLVNRLRRNPDEKMLDEVLPAALYSRYVALRSQYFPREDDPVRLRPFFAGTRLTDRILQVEGLESGESIMRRIERLIRRTRAIERTEVEIEFALTGSFRSVAERARTLSESLSREQELACFDKQLRRVESELDAIKSQANAWAHGNIDDFRGISLPGDAGDACLLIFDDSSEFETIEQLYRELDARWLAAAERALAVNDTTFAILDIVDLLREDGLMAEIRALGYQVAAP
jgi:hypothetical protein